MRAVVVHDQMDFQIRRRLLFDGAQELQEFRGAMTTMQLSRHLTSGQIQRGKLWWSPVSIPNFNEIKVIPFAQATAVVSVV